MVPAVWGQWSWLLVRSFTDKIACGVCMVVVLSWELWGSVGVRRVDMLVVMVVSSRGGRSHHNSVQKMVAFLFRPSFFQAAHTKIDGVVFAPPAPETPAGEGQGGGGGEPVDDAPVWVGDMVLCACGHHRITTRVLLEYGILYYMVVCCGLIFSKLKQTKALHRAGLKSGPAQPFPLLGGSRPFPVLF